MEEKINIQKGLFVAINCCGNSKLKENTLALYKVLGFTQYEDRFHKSNKHGCINVQGQEEIQGVLRRVKETILRESYDSLLFVLAGKGKVLTNTNDQKHHVIMCGDGQTMQTDAILEIFSGDDAIHKTPKFFLFEILKYVSPNTTPEQVQEWRTSLEQIINILPESYVSITETDETVFDMEVAICDWMIYEAPEAGEIFSYIQMAMWMSSRLCIHSDFYIFSRKSFTKDYILKVVENLHQSNRYCLKLLIEGGKPCTNIRTMVLGHAREGKTHLCRRILQKPVGDIEGTNGIDIYRYDYVINLQTKQRGTEVISEEDAAVQKQSCALSLILKEKQELKLIEKDAENNVTSKETVNDGQSNKAPKITAISVNDGQSKMAPNENAIGQIDKKSNVSKHGNAISQLDEKLPRNECSSNERDTPDENGKQPHLPKMPNIEDIIKGCQTVNEDTAYMSIWDFGGESIFYDSHHMFMSADAVFLVVFNILRLLSEKCFDEVRFWLHTIATYSLNLHNPPIILIGTHSADLPGDTKEEKEALFHEICDEILRMADPKDPDAKLIQDLIVGCFPVENDEQKCPQNTQFDEIFSCIVDNAKYQSQWGRKIPIKWFIMERRIMVEKGKGTNLMPLETLIWHDKRTVRPIGNIEDIKECLKHLHVMGYIIFFDEGEGLPATIQNKFHVIINPHWIIRAFRRIITDDKFTEPRLGVMWRRYKKDAELYPELIEKLFEKRKNDDEDFNEEKGVVLGFMERLGLIATPLKQEEERYIVPTMLPKITEQDITPFCKMLKKETTVCTKTLCMKIVKPAISFTIFHKVMAACTATYEKANKNIANSSLMKDFGCFRLTNNWHFCLFYSYDMMIRVTMFKIQPHKEVSTLGVGYKTKTFLEKTLLTIFKMHGQCTEPAIFEYFMDMSPNKGTNSTIPIKDLEALSDPEDGIEHHEDHFVLKKDLDCWFEEEDELPKDWPTDAECILSDYEIPVCKLSENQNMYSMQRNPRGRVLIINNFVHKVCLNPPLAKRFGTEDDENGIAYLFTQLYFEVEIHRDKSAEEMRCIFDNERQNQLHVNAQCIIIIVLSHGNADGLYGIDGNVVRVKDIEEMYNGANFAVMNDKPKLLFIQACRSDSKIPSSPANGGYVSQLIRYSRACSHYQDFVTRRLLLTSKFLRQDNSLPRLRSALRKFHGRHNDTAERFDNYVSDIIKNSICKCWRVAHDGPNSKSDSLVRDNLQPKHAHFFIAYATTDDTVALRDQYIGSYFIQAIIYIFRKFSHRQHIKDMFTKVSNLVTKVVQQKRDGVTVTVSEQRSTLVKDLYFFPGIHKEAVKIRTSYLSDEVLKFVERYLGDEWERIVSSLGLKQEDINRIKMEHLESTGQKQAALYFWRDKIVNGQRMHSESLETKRCCLCKICFSLCLCITNLDESQEELELNEELITLEENCQVAFDELLSVLKQHGRGDVVEKINNRFDFIN